MENRDAGSTTQEYNFLTKAILRNTSKDFTHGGLKSSVVVFSFYTISGDGGAREFSERRRCVVLHRNRREQDLYCLVQAQDRDKSV